jgi:hypothetical protein
MAILCPACSKRNPKGAAYCYYDGRALSDKGQGGPLHIGTLAFPMPFCFASGQTCANFNQLALACDERWNEARGLLANGTWPSFFSAIGRLDLAAAATRAAKEADLDVGLSLLLEQLPADPKALRRPKLALASAEENLGNLAPGTDHRFDVEITNQGMLVLRGMAKTDCDWLSLGDVTGSSLKMFQTRRVYTLPVRVLGNKLRAGPKALEGQIVIDTNGGTIALPVRAEVPVRPFAGGRDANDVLAGAKSPRELAIKARAHPNEAAALFEQGAVKVWYESNGWSYPVQGTQASGKAAVQQFFEALGLTKPPRLEASIERLQCKGAAGQRLTRQVTLSTTEPRPVYAQAWSNQSWVKAGPAKSQGNKATVPLVIEVPDRPGATMHADVTVQGNGQQTFGVRVTLEVVDVPTAVSAGARETSGGLPLGCIAAGVGSLLVLATGVGAVAFVVHHQQQKEGPPPAVAIAAPTAPATEPKKGPWWDGMAGANLGDETWALKQAARLEDQTLLDGIAAQDEVERRAAYERLAAEVPKLWGNEKAREPLGRLLADCCVFEPSPLCQVPLGQAVTGQILRDGVGFRPDAKGEELERALWSLQVFGAAVTHKAVRQDRVRRLAGDLGRIFGPELDERAPPDQLKAQAEQLLVRRCYRNTVPTAKESVDHALAMRELLIERFPQHLDAAERAKVDVELLAAGLPRGNDAWPKLEPIWKTCVESNDPAVGTKVADLYEQADQAAAAKMVVLLRARWKRLKDPKLTRPEQVQVLRTSLARAAASAAISPQARMKQLSDLTAKTLASGKAARKKETALLQDTVRLAHASTMACALFQKDDGGEGAAQFDELVKGADQFEKLVAQIPDIDRPAQAKGPDKAGGPKQLAAKGKPVPNKATSPLTGSLTLKSKIDPSRPGFYCNQDLYYLKAGQPYTCAVAADFAAEVRVEDANGNVLAQDADHVPPFGFRRISQVRFSFTPQADGDYQVVVSTSFPGTGGAYQFQIKKGYDAGGMIAGRGAFGPGGMFLPGAVPGQPGVGPGQPAAAPAQPAPKANEKEDKQLSESDLRDCLRSLDGKKSADRVAAFVKIADGAADDLTPPQAQVVAKYLLLTVAREGELDEVKAKLESFADDRYLLLALADLAGDETAAIAQRNTELIVGGVLGRELRFAGDEDWRSGCRKLLLRRALDLTGTAMIGADQAAGYLRALYTQQGAALGIEDSAFFELPGPTQVLEGLIKHVAAKAAGQNPVDGDKEYLDRIDRELRVAQFLAANDLEHMVLLQRVWVRVLTIYLQGQAPAQAGTLAQVRQGLDDQDQAPPGVLDQLRAGEEKALRAWALANNIKAP